MKQRRELPEGWGLFLATVETSTWPLTVGTWHLHRDRVPTSQARRPSWGIQVRSPLARFTRCL